MGRVHAKARAAPRREHAPWLRASGDQTPRELSRQRGLRAGERLIIVAVIVGIVAVGLALYLTSGSPLPLCYGC